MAAPLQQPFPQAIIPALPRDPKIIDKTSGEINSEWYNFFQQLTLALQTTLNNEGLLIPPLAADDIALLGNNAQSVGTMMYDSTNNVFKGMLNVPQMDPNDPIVTQTVTFTT